MSRICQLTGKRPITGNNVSHSKRRTKRRFLPNLIKKRMFVPEVNEWVELKMSAKALRNINKIGLYEYLKRQQKAGFDIGIDLNKK